MVYAVKDIPGSTTDLGQSQHDTPDLTLVAQSIFADSLQLGVTVGVGVSGCSYHRREQWEQALFSGRVRTDERIRKDDEGPERRVSVFVPMLEKPR